ncbi:MAG: TVP38/TMEM64 family protein [Micromonosporaceae bacterium]
MGASFLWYDIPDRTVLTDHVRVLGGWAPVAAVAATAAMVTVLVPRTFLAAVAGLLLGPVMGGACVLAGAAIGASLAFGVGRWLARDFVRSRRRIAAVDQWVSSGGVLSVLTVRLLPVAPFGLVSYAFGASGVRFPAYLAGTALGVVPSTAVYATVGANAMSPGTWGFYASLAAAAILLIAGLTGAAILRRRRGPQTAS